MRYNFHYTIILFVLIFFSCKVSFHAPSEPTGFNIEPGTKSFALIDCGIANSTGIAIKKKREGVVKQVKIQYMILLNTALKQQLNLNSITDTTLTEDEKKNLLKKDPEAMLRLSNKYPSAIILILKNCYAGFRQDEVKKVGSWDGKSDSKVAEYSVFFESEWLILQGNTTNEKTVTASKHHSSRTIQSGLLARGPGFEANKKDILAVAEQNAFNVSVLFKY